MKYLILLILICGCVTPRVPYQGGDMPQCVREWFDKYYCFDELIDPESDCKVFHESQCGIEVPEGSDVVCCCREQNKGIPLTRDGEL